MLYGNYNYIRRINIDGSGSESVRYLGSGLRVYAVDFDFRLIAAYLDFMTELMTLICSWLL